MHFSNYPILENLKVSREVNYYKLKNAIDKALETKQKVWLPNDVFGTTGNQEWHSSKANFFKNLNDVLKAYDLWLGEESQPAGPGNLYIEWLPPGDIRRKLGGLD